MELDSMCRVCLKEGSGTKLKSIFSLEKRDGDHTVKCPNMLVQCASVTIYENDGYPNHICDACYKQLWSAYKFRVLCEKSFQYLTNCVSEDKSELKIKVEKREDYISSNIEDLNSVDENEENLSLFRKVKVEIGGDMDNDSNNSDYPNVENNEDDSEISSDKDVEKFTRNSKKTKRKHDITDIGSKKLNKGKENGRWKCSHCPKDFKFKHQLLSHEDCHIGIKRYFCETCQKAYRSEKDHKRKHRAAFNFKCETCSKYFSSKSLLATHAETHKTNRKKILCGLNGCVKEFVSPLALQQHRKSHDGVRNMVCHICSKSYLDKYTLQTHLRRHINDRKYKCSYCDKRFFTGSNKASHEKLHLNIRNYPCPNCDQKFYNSGALSRHSLSHSKEIKEECRFCGKGFSRRDNRRRHEAAIHGLSEDNQEKVIPV